MQLIQDIDNLLSQAIIRHF